MQGVRGAQQTQAGSPLVAPKEAAKESVKTQQTPVSVHLPTQNETPALPPRVVKAVSLVAPLRALSPAPGLPTDESPLVRASTLAELATNVAEADASLTRARASAPVGSIPNSFEVQALRQQWLNANKALRDGKPELATSIFRGMGLPGSSKSERTLIALGGSTAEATSTNWMAMGRVANTVKGAAQYASLLATMRATKLDAASVQAYIGSVRAQNPGNPKAVLDAQQQVMAGGFVHPAEVSSTEDMTLPEEDGLAPLLRAPRYGGRVTADCERMGAVRMLTLPSEYHPVAFATAVAKNQDGPPGHLVSVIRDDAHNYYVVSNNAPPQLIKGSIDDAVAAELKSDVTSKDHAWGQFEIHLTAARPGENAEALIARYRKNDFNVATADLWSALSTQ